MFTRIARRYDLMNSLMTGGRHHAWRGRVAAAATEAPAGPALDLATGTADLAIALRLRNPGRLIVGADFSDGMLQVGRGKLDAGRVARVPLLAADALALPFPDGGFDAATVAFGARNLADLDAGLREMARVVRPGGRVVVLEITAPERLRAAEGVWFDRVVPRLGRAVGGDGAAYAYLPASAKRFPRPPELAARMARAGLGDIRFRTFVGGLVALHHGRVAP